MKIANAFSIGMLPTNKVTTAWFAGPRTAEEIKLWIATNLREGMGNALSGYSLERLESVIGHADTARLVSDELGVDLPMNRVSVKLEPFEVMIVAQYSGPRLPEGATELPDGAKIEYYIVTVAEVE